MIPAFHWLGTSAIRPPLALSLLQITLKKANPHVVYTLYMDLCVDRRVKTAHWKYLFQMAGVWKVYNELELKTREVDNKTLNVNIYTRHNHNRFNLNHPN